MGSSYLISDLHLSEAQPQLVDAFFAFLDGEAKNADALYILGDFFDAWIGDDDDSDFAYRIKAKLKAYSSSDTHCYFMHGNRDFLIGKQFSDETGFELLHEGTLAEIYGEHYLLMHGDSLCTDDTEYMQFRAMVRSPEWQQQILALPLAQRRLMAQELRAKSKSMSAIKAEDIMDVNQIEVERALLEKDSNILIHGHTHRPNTHQFEKDGSILTRYVLGDWGSKGWALRITEESKEPLAMSWPID